MIWLFLDKKCTYFDAYVQVNEKSIMVPCYVINMPENIQWKCKKNQL